MDSRLEMALLEAKGALDAVDVPGEWKASAYGVVVAHLLAGTAPGDKAPLLPLAVLGPEGVDKLGLTADQLADFAVIDLVTNEARLNIPSNKIAVAKSAATRQLALLVVSMRLALGLDNEVVDSQHVRTALEEYNRYDLANFSANLKRFEEEMSATKKDGKLWFRLRRQGWEKATEMWEEVVGDVK